MCGIVGLFNRERPVQHSDEECMERVLNRIAYRGPDGFELWRCEKVLLGHRRLSIIDLSDAGAQPFEIAEMGLVISFNGEIYNFKELRELLISHGYTFRSHSDTEVILLAYDYYGGEFLRHLHGMFAFCLFDRRRNRAILARDRMGEKPLYYYFDANRFILASEIKVFHAFPEIELAIDIQSVKAFFSLQYIPGTSSIYTEVKRLPAGVMLELNLDKWNLSQHKYWSLQECLNKHVSTPEEIDYAISESVKQRLVADVEVGLLLSGGIDSALLASYAHDHGAKLRVFTARFDEANLDESKYARQVSDHLGFQRVVVPGGQLTPETFDQIIFHGDELLGDPACVPTFLLSREISKHLKVVLSGEGADELFWGYDTYRFEKVWRWLLWLRGVLSRVSGFQHAVSDWETSSQVPAGLTRLGKLLSAKYDIGAARWTSVFADHTVGRLIPSGNDNGQISYLREIEQRVVELTRHMDSFNASLSVDLLYWLPDDLLMKVDRMTMAHSVETRAPYLDPDLISKVLVLPWKNKLRGDRGKFVLRKFVERRFPGAVGRSLAWRRKHGFEVPVNSWLRQNLRECVDDRLSPVRLAKSGLLNVAFATKVKESFYSSSVDTPLRRKVWLLLCFQTWYELHETGFGFR
ncbi:MAG: asparagine synthase (glutamine-hydrolyzing) [Anaerolineales bacterium]|nr:asparagine synthase (glutamine-hydrolyzing) [Anaerolineales bacterium]